MDQIKHDEDWTEDQYGEGNGPCSCDDEVSSFPLH